MLTNFFTVTLVTLIIKIVCLLVTIAYYTLAERKIMASVQRRLGPNVVGFWGLLQPLADGLKLFGKELVIPSHANSRIFIFAPMGVLGCAFLAWGVIPFHLFDHSVNMSVTEVTEILLNTTGSSTTLVLAGAPVNISSPKATRSQEEEFNFNSWLGGLIDGDGHFYLLKHKYAACAITAHEDETEVLFKIQQQLGGTVNRCSDNKGRTVRAFQWRLTGREKMLALVCAVNGNIQLASRYKQFEKVCAALQVRPQPFVKSSNFSWLAGFFDADGHISVASGTRQLRVTVSQKDGALVKELQASWGGNLYKNLASGTWEWYATSENLLPLVTYLACQLQGPIKAEQAKIVQRLLALRAEKTEANAVADRALCQVFWDKKAARKR